MRQVEVSVAHYRRKDPSFSLTDPHAVFGIISDEKERAYESIAATSERKSLTVRSSQPSAGRLL